MIPNSLLIHRITVKEYKGNGPYGPLYDDPYEAQCYFEKKHELVRDSTGQEIVSSARAFGPDMNHLKVLSLLRVKIMSYHFSKIR